MKNNIKIYFSCLFYLPVMDLHSDELIGELTDSSYYVVTPTTIQENVHDTPAAVTVIQGDDLIRRGVSRLEDIFRYVPGMSVLIGDRNTSKVAYHGTNNENPRRMLILIDGKTIPFNENLQWVRWETMPFGVGDIEKVEVVRSPSNALYGGNAAQATVNFILKDSISGRGEIGGRYGSQDTKEINLRTNLVRNERAKVYFSAGHRESSGYDEDFISANDRLVGSTPFDGSIDVENEWREAHDDYNVDYFSLNSSIYLGSNTELDVFAGYSKFDNTNRTVNVSFEFVEEVDPDHSVKTSIYGEQYYLTVNLDHKIDLTKELSLSVSGSRQEDNDEWSDCRHFNLSYWQETYDLYDFNGEDFFNQVYFPTLQQRFDPSSLSPQELAVWGPWASRIGADPAAAFARDVCADWELGVVADRVTAQGLFKWSPNDTTKLVIGGGAKYYDLDSQALYGGNIREDRYNVMFNLTNFIGPFTSHLGVYAEEFSLSDDVYISPRLALNYKLNNYHSVKLIHAVSHTDPPILAREAKWQFDTIFTRHPTGEDAGTFYWHVFGDEEVEAEKITSSSLVFVGQSRTNPISYNVKIFKEKLDALIPSLLDIFAWDPSNTSYSKQEGVEFSLNWQTISNNSAGISASYIDNKSETEVEQSLHSQWIAGAYLTKKLSESLFLTAQFNHNEIVDVEYDELNLYLKMDVPIGDLAIQFGASLTYYFQDEHLKYYKRPINQEYRAFYTRYDSQVHGALDAKLLF